MSSGSYFTVYRKDLKAKASQEVLDALKNEYFLANKKDSFGGSKSEEEMRKDIPLLMHASFKEDFHARETAEKTDVYYSADGSKHTKLLEFHFCSTFSCLKEKFNLNPYSFSNSSALVSKSEAAKMLQAVEYILGEEYSKHFEKVLDNEYVELFGEGYSPYDNRFSQYRQPINIDKHSDGGYSVEFSDYGFEREIAESDSDVKYNLEKTRACLLAFLKAEDNSWDNEELVLEYSAY